MKKLLLLPAIFLLLISFSMAQNINISDITRIRMQDIGTIKNNNQVKGYFYFYKVDKASRKENNYLLQVLDENLREVNSANIIRSKYYHLIEGEYNGEGFAFMFYDLKTKMVELVSYDKTLKQTGSVIKPVKGLANQSHFRALAAGETEIDHDFLIAVPGKGFLYYGYAEGKKHKFEIEGYDNSMKKNWTYGSEQPETKLVEIADEAFQSDNYVGSLITTKKSLMSRDFNYHLVVNNLQSGTVRFKTELKDDQYNISTSLVSYDPEANNIIVFGEYYNLNEKETKATSLGFFYETLSVDGKVLNKKFLSWEDDISQVVDVDKRGRLSKGSRIMVHKFVRTGDGQIFIIGEQYEKAASGAGIAMNALAAMSGGSSRTATVQLNILNMMIFQFNSDFTIKSVDVFEKSKSVMLLPSGSEWTPSKTLSYMAKSRGYFDYQFTEINKDKTVFNVCYVDYEKTKGEKAKNVVGSITFADKKYSLDKAELNRKSTHYLVQPGKAGYLMITEYYKKEKKLDMRLEKINY